MPTQVSLWWIWWYIVVSDNHINQTTLIQMFHCSDVLTVTIISLIELLCAYMLWLYHHHIFLVAKKSVPHKLAIFYIFYAFFKFYKEKKNTESILCTWSTLIKSFFKSKDLINTYCHSLIGHMYLPNDFSRTTFIESYSSNKVRTHYSDIRFSRHSFYHVSFPKSRFPV